MSEQFLIPTYARQPVSFERGEGVWLYDADGNRFMDAVSGIAVCNLGHAHPAVTRTLADQAARVVHTSNLYRVPAQEELAARLCALSGMEKVFFSNSGAEANEAAIKLARLHGHHRGSDTPRILVMENSFHGRTLATLSATGNRKVQKGFEPLVEGFQHLPYNDLAAVEAAAADDQAGHIAAVLVEPVQGEGGVNVPDDGYLRGLRELCDRHGWLLMLDEIQTGNGRTGSYFACQGDDVRPDVLTTASCPTAPISKPIWATTKAASGTGTGQSTRAAAWATNFLSWWSAAVTAAAPWRPGCSPSSGGKPGRSGVVLVSRSAVPWKRGTTA